MLPASVYESLRAVEGLVAGKCKAKETEAVKPVAEDHADAVLDFLSPQIRAMIELQALTGMRPAEVCAMRGCDLDTTGARWAYKPEQHKTKHRGHDRVIPLGPLARDIVAKFLGTDLRAHLFNPSEAAEARRQLHHEQRKTPENQGNNIGTNRKRRPRIAPGERFLVDAYRRAISRACDRAFLPPDHLAKQKDESVAAWKKRLTDEQHAELRAWRRAHRFHPHQLRHTFATKVRAQYGPDVALTLLGDRTTRMVDVYAAKDHATAVQVAEKIG
jgi:integrase